MVFLLGKTLLRLVLEVWWGFFSSLIKKSHETKNQKNPPRQLSYEGSVFNIRKLHSCGVWMLS